MAGRRWNAHGEPELGVPRGHTELELLRRRPPYPGVPDEHPRWPRPFSLDDACEEEPETEWVSGLVELDQD